MKTRKVLLMIFVSVFTIFATVSCAENLVLTNLLRATGDMETASVTYSSDDLESNDGFVTEMSYTVYNSDVVLLETGDLITFNELRLDIIDLHDQIVSERETIRSLAESIRETVTTIRDNGYVLLEEDKTIILDSIETLKELRADLIGTKGEAYQRIYDLRGTYTRDNLPQIITVYSEVITVLEYRLDLFQQAVEILQNVNDLLSDYTES